jgi:hypothetical protein
MTPSPPSPEAFLSAPPDPDEDAEPDIPTFTVEEVFTPDPLQSIAESLKVIAGTAEADREVEEQTAEFMARTHTAEREAVRLREQLEHIAAIIKPSTSKLAKQIRAVLDAPTEDPEPDAHAGGTGQPADDASVEAWRQFARTMVSPDVVDMDWGSMNRSQIRTALGIAQPTPSTDG